MLLNRLLSLAWKGLSTNKLRSLLTMLGVIIGVAAVIVMISVSAGTEAAIEEQITGLGSNLVYISASFNFGRPGTGAATNSGGGLVYSDAGAISESVNGIAGVMVEQGSNEDVKVGNLTIEGVEVTGSTPDLPSVRDLTIDVGRYFNETEVDRSARVAVLGSDLAAELFGESNPVGETVTVGNQRMTVIGIFEEKGLVGERNFDSAIYIPITVVFDRFTPSFFAAARGDRVRQIIVELDPEVDSESVIQQIELLLIRLHDVTADTMDFSISTQQDVIETEEAATSAFRNLLAWVAGVSLVVGGIGIMNIMMVSVTERTREIGIRQSVGATPNDIRFQFLTEAFLLSLVGGVLGIVTGVLGSWLFGIAGDLPTVVVPSSIALAFGSAAAVGIFFGYYPANQAAQLDPIEALRHE